MQQLTLFGDPPRDTIVNVAQVPQRSPFRYAGGKTWLVPRVRQWLGAQPRRPALLIEPFAGGASVGLTAAFEGLADHVLLAELDEDVGAVWATILGGGAEDLAARIECFSLTAAGVASALAAPPDSSAERAFQTILRNRVNRGGILAPGAGRVKAGENGKGLASRWYPATLAARIRAIGALRSRISFMAGDGLALLHTYGTRADAAFFLDPPYTAGHKGAGYRLYRHAQLDHAALFAAAAAVEGDFLLTYEAGAAVQGLAAQHGLVTRQIAMKTTHHAALHELLIGRNLEWADH